MNIQTERLENHKARFTVEVEPERLDKAKQAAARNIAKRVNIPGFRKGKAPYKILVSYVGEAAILEDAMELLGQEIYREAIDQAEIDPFGPGELEDFKLDPNPTFIFTVDLQPTVDLGDYRAIREEYEAPAVDDEMVDRALRLMQEERALVEESSQPAALGNRLTVDIHSFFADGAGQAEDAASGEEPEAELDAEADANETHEGEGEEGHDDHHHHEDDDVFIHQHDAVIRLEEGDDEPILPGFAAAMLGATAGETREFELTVPNDTDDYDEDIVGRPVKFMVTVKRIETMTLPVLNDDFAARVTEDEEQPLTLLELRMRVRENLEKEAERRARTTFANRVLDKVVEQAQISYPEALVEEQSEEFLKDLDRRLRQEGLTLEDYMKVLNKTKEDLYADYREPAIRSVERQLVMLNLLRAEQLEIADQEIDQEVDRMLESFGEQGANLRSIFGSKQVRSNIANDLLTQKLYDRLSAIATGTLEAQTGPETSVAESAESEQAAEEASDETAASPS